MGNKAMIERMAKAIAESLGFDWSFLPERSSLKVEGDKEGFRDAARAALKAREKTDG